MRLAITKLFTLKKVLFIPTRFVLRVLRFRLVCGGTETPSNILYFEYYCQALLQIFILSYVGMWKTWEL